MFALRFHKFQCKTCVSLAFSIGAHATHVFSLRFQLVPCNTCVFLMFSISCFAKPVFSLRLFNRSPCNKCVFFTFSIGSHATLVFSFGFPLVSAQHLCFQCVFYIFPRNTYVFHVFSKDPTQHDYNTIVFILLLYGNVVFPFGFIRFVHVVDKALIFIWVVFEQLQNQLQKNNGLTKTNEK